MEFLPQIKKLFLVIYKRLDTEGYFQKYFGIDCTDGFIEGQLGSEIDAIVFVNLRKENLYPILLNLTELQREREYTNKLNPYPLNISPPSVQY